MTEKQALRDQMQRVREGISSAEAKAQAEQVLRLLLAWPMYQAAQTVMLYAALPGELPTQGLMQATLDRGKRLLLPRCEAGRCLSARPAPDLSRLYAGPWGIPEPHQEECTVDPRDIDLVFCPGLAFGRDGSRLGWGAGYYDRFLAETPALRVGLCFSQQLLPEVPLHPHDRPMQYIVTAEGIHPAERGGKIP